MTSFEDTPSVVSDCPDAALKLTVIETALSRTFGRCTSKHTSMGSQLEHVAWKPPVFRVSGKPTLVHKASLPSDPHDLTESFARSAKWCVGTPFSGIIGTRLHGSLVEKVSRWISRSRTLRESHSAISRHVGYDPGSWLLVLS